MQSSCIGIEFTFTIHFICGTHIGFGLGHKLVAYVDNVMLLDMIFIRDSKRIQTLRKTAFWTCLSNLVSRIGN